MGDRFAAHPQGEPWYGRHDQLGIFQTALLGRITPASTLTKLPVISGVNRLTILADNDANNVSQQAATKLYHTYNRAGRDAVIKHPRAVDTDFNDLLRNGAGR